MNVDTSAPHGEVVEVFESNDYTTNVVQNDRHAWNGVVDRFEAKHCSAATGTFGFLDCGHGRFWDVGGAFPGPHTSMEKCPTKPSSSRTGSKRSNECSTTSENGSAGTSTTS